MMPQDISGTESNELRFQVDVGLLFQLGEQLVTRPSIALAELIKNSYDADATFVDVIFQEITTEGGAILIQDNGSGMTLDQFRRYWMMIATDHKRRSTHSEKYNRPRAGAKGIGRFATRKLARQLTVETVAKYPDGVKRRLLVKFDWDKFESGTPLDSVPVVFELQDEPNSATGTMLILEGLHDRWTRKEIDALSKDLTGILDPYALGSSGDDSFSTNLQIRDFPDYSGPIEDRFLDIAWAVLSGKVDADGKAHYRLRIREPAQERSYTSEFNYPGIVGATLEINFMVYRPEYFEGVGGFSLRDVQRLGRDKGGVRIYLDGFRVFPYGERDDDWLKLNEIRARRTPGLSVQRDRFLDSLLPEAGTRPELLTPGNNQVFGRVNISQTQQREIQISVSRERLLENEAFHELRDWVTRGIWWLTLEYARVTLSDRLNRRAPVRRNQPEYDREVKAELQEKLAQSGVQEDVASAVADIFQQFADTKREEREELLNQLQILRILSAAGTAVVLTQHQLQALLNDILGLSSDLDDIQARISEPYSAGIIRISAKLRRWYDSASDQIKLFGLLTGSGSRKSKRRHQAYTLVQEVVDSLAYWARDKHVSVRNHIPRNLRTPPVHSAVMTAVILHVFTNALKAVRRQPERIIQFEAQAEEDKLVLFVKDTGVGISPDQREIVFEPFQSFSDPDLSLGIGTGLGLAVVRDLLSEYVGTAQFIDSSPPWHTTLVITIPEK